MVLSLLPLASLLPSGLNATLQTGPVCSSSVAISSPETPSHKRTVLSELALVSLLPSGLKTIS